MDRSIMVLEDEPFISVHVSDVLRDYGLSTTGPFRTNAEALRSLESHRPRAAIIDLNVADGRSYPTVERLRSLGVPFLVISGSPRSGADPEALSEADWLEKPFSEQALVRTLVSLMDNKAAV